MKRPSRRDVHGRSTPRAQLVPRALHPPCGSGSARCPATMGPMRTPRLLLPGGALVLALAACSGPRSTQAASPTETAHAPESSTPEDAAPQDETAPEPRADADARDADGPAPAAGDAACREGTWIYRASE